VTAVHHVSATIDGTDCVVQIYGTNLGRKYELYDPIVTIGRDPRNTIIIDSDSVSRRHAVIELCDAGRLVRDMDSTNGTYLNDIQVRSAILSNSDLLKIGDTIFKYLSGDNVESLYHEEIYRMTIQDGLTDIANKRHLMDYLDKELARARRHGRKLSVVMFDIDHFKDINDRYGHLTGDYVLKDLAAMLKKRIRKEELFARYGGEEFVVVLPEASREESVEFAEIVRKLVQKHPFEFENQPISVTVSVGIASVTDKTQSVQDLLKEADENMYRAKKEGRNRVAD